MGRSGYLTAATAAQYREILQNKPSWPNPLVFYSICRRA
jgi:hypothetical protein